MLYQRRQQQHQLLLLRSEANPQEPLLLPPLPIEHWRRVGSGSNLRSIRVASFSTTQRPRKAPGRPRLEAWWQNVSLCVGPASGYQATGRYSRAHLGVLAARGFKVGCCVLQPPILCRMYSTCCQRGPLAFARSARRSQLWGTALNASCTFAPGATPKSTTLQIARRRCGTIQW